MKIREINPSEGNKVRFLVTGVPLGCPVEVYVQWGTKGRNVLFSSRFNPEDIRGVKLNCQFGFEEIIKLDDSIFQISLRFNGTHNKNTKLKIVVSVGQEKCCGRFRKI